MPTYIFNTFNDPSASTGTQAWGVNGTDQTVGFYSDASGYHGFLFSGGVFTGVFTTLNDPSATNGTFATGINATGQIVGSFHDNTSYHGFLYNPNGGTYTTL